MKNRSIGVLIAANVMLLATLAFLWVTPEPVQAQLGGRGNYIMIAGQTNDRPEDIIYVCDLTSAKVVAFLFNSTNKRIDKFAVQDLAADMGLSGRR
ncbi:MAG: hypothetical protein QF785_08055 [Phycisphaeraceae bacterium]|jgi:hypothetical protein|nr:hypothetical protein [Phycisphaeraceae bacterium]